MRSLAGALVPTVLGLVVLAAVIGSGDGSPVIGAVVVGAVGIVFLVAIAWIRQFPVRPGDEAAYGKAATIKLAVTPSANPIRVGASATASLMVTALP